MKDELEITLTREQFAELTAAHKDIVEKYSCVVSTGDYVFSWDDIERYADQWDTISAEALTSMQDVPQPLIHYMNTNTVWELLNYLDGSAPYTLVKNLIWHAEADYQKIA